MSWSTALRAYATKKDPSTLPATVLFSHTDSTITIFDAYPKAIFHFLILPRPSQRLSVLDLSSLRSLIRKDDDLALETLKGLQSEAEKLKGEIHAEMLERYGFTWPLHCGFHAIPSMEHLHLHVISADLTSPSLKNKKHYNSFKPGHGFFLPLDDVLEWFDGSHEHLLSMSNLKKGEYEALLKQELTCHHCDRGFKTIPQLKGHLQEEWDALRQRGTRKRRKSPDDSKQTPDGQPAAKKRAFTREPGESRTDAEG
ncbi:HIT-like protein [Peniophora sp. CONT]|nr:HIT-like protein [Peniophora sp. CONT]